MKLKVPIRKKLQEGIRYNKDANEFEFDFREDKIKDVIHLVILSEDISMTLCDDKTYTYGYELRKEGVKSSFFVSWLKEQFDKGINSSEIEKFINDALKRLHHTKNLNDFKCIIYPDTTQNKLVEYIIRKIKDIIYDFNGPTTFYSIIKNLPSQIEFDWDKFMYENKELYTPTHNKIKESKRIKLLNETEKRINTLMDSIHQKDYFKLHKCGFDINERKYIRKFFTLKDNENDDYETLKNLIKTDQVLLVDDTITSGTTIDEMIRTISIINPNCDIVIFTLIKGKDGKF